MQRGVTDFGAEKMPDDLLVKAAKITMANSLELRVPLPGSLVSRHIFAGETMKSFSECQGNV